MSKKQPFGDITADVGKERLFTIGIGVGMIIGVAAPNNTIRVVLGIVGLFLIVVRYLAQVYWPDRRAGGEPDKH